MWSSTRRNLVRAAAGVLIAGAAAMPAAAQDRVRLLLDWIPTGDYAAYFAGLDRGFFREAGIELSIERGFGGSDTVTKLGAGAAPFGLADIGSLMAGRVRTGVPVRAIASIYTRPPHSIFVMADSPIRSFRDLEGRRLTGAPGSSVRVFLPMVLRQVGADIGRVNLVNAEPATLGPLLLSGQTDAIMGFIPNLPRFQAIARQQNRDVRAIEMADQLEIYGNVLMASESVLAQNPDLARRMVAALVRSMEFTRDNPREAFASLSRAIPGLNPTGDFEAMQIATRLMFDSNVARSQPIGSFEPAQLRRSWLALAEAQQLDAAATDPESFVARDIAPRR